jgi:hypothetical protein
VSMRVQSSTTNSAYRLNQSAVAACRCILYPSTQGVQVRRSAPHLGDALYRDAFEGFVFPEAWTCSPQPGMIGVRVRVASEQQPAIEV